MTKRKLPYTPFGRKTLQLAWEGWYHTWQLVHWILPLSYPRMTEARRRDLAENTLRLFLDEKLISLQRINYVKETWADLSAREAAAALRQDSYWNPASTRRRSRRTHCGSAAVRPAPSPSSIPSSRPRSCSPSTLTAAG